MKDHKHIKPHPRHEKDFTGGSALTRSCNYVGTTGESSLDKELLALAEKIAPHDRECLLAEMMITAVRLSRGSATDGDIKMLNRALKEMSHANEVFSGFRKERKVAIFGSARTKPTEPEYVTAVRFAKQMKEEGFMTITGAGPGIMAAGNEGAGREDSFGLNISLPFETSANEFILNDEKLIDFNYFFTRKLSFVKEADAAVAFPGGVGTMDELFEALTLIQTGKATVYPIVLVDAKSGKYWKFWQQFMEEHLIDEFGPDFNEDTDEIRDYIIETFTDEFIDTQTAPVQTYFKQEAAILKQFIDEKVHDFPYSEFTKQNVDLFLYTYVGTYIAFQTEQTLLIHGDINQIPKFYKRAKSPFSTRSLAPKPIAFMEAQAENTFSKLINGKGPDYYTSETIKTAIHNEIKHSEVVDTDLPKTQESYDYLRVAELYTANLNFDLLVINGLIRQTKEGQNDGLSSLQQALSYAGCLSTLTSTWEIEPKANTILMNHFYQNLKQGMSKAEALTVAKRTFIEQQKDQTHPYFWSNYL